MVLMSSTIVAVPAQRAPGIAVVAEAVNGEDHRLWQFFCAFSRRPYRESEGRSVCGNIAVILNRRFAQGFARRDHRRRTTRHHDRERQRRKFTGIHCKAHDYTPGILAT